jgi:hypothetical protein
LVDRARVFLPEVFHQKLLCLIAVLHLLFSIVEQDEFRDLLLYSSPQLRYNDILPKSSTTIKMWLLELFLLSQALLIKLLLTSGTKIHISFDLWSSPNHFSILGIVGHFIDIEFKACTVLLGMKRLLGPYSRENIAHLLIKVIKAYKLAKVLGFCVLDNTGDNDTFLGTVQAYLLSEEVVWNRDSYRLRCFGHIVSLIAGAFTANKPLKLVRSKGAPKPVKVL